jgi:hypothetical protein
MNKKISLILLLLIISVAIVFAQSSATVDGWLRTAHTKSTTALSLARQNYDANADRIYSLYLEIQDLVLKVQNYFNQGNILTESQVERLTKIQANIMRLIKG